MILAGSDMLTASDLDFGRRRTPVTGMAAVPMAASPSSAIGGDGGRSLHRRLQEQERAEIVSAVEQAQGNIAHASRSLGINRSTLYYRMRKHGLEHLLPTREDTPEPGPAAAE
jgi:transcriptional regulator of acetoin/glycerol metabolism